MNDIPPMPGTENSKHLRWGGGVETKRIVAVAGLLLVVAAMLWMERVLPAIPTGGRVIRAFRLQETDYDCGAASLKYVLEAFGIEKSLRELRVRTGTSREGVSMLALKHAALELGLDCEGWDYPVELLGQVPLPAIVFLLDGHFAVVTEVTAQEVRLIDPARGELLVPRVRFPAIWRGKTLIFKSRKEW